MPDEFIKKLVDSTSLRTIFRTGDPLIENRGVRLALYLLSIISPLAILINAEIYDSTAQVCSDPSAAKCFNGLISFVITSSTIGPIVILSAIIGAVVTGYVLYRADKETFISESTVGVTISYLLAMIFTRYSVVDQKSPFTFIALSTVVLVYLLIIGKRLSDPLFKRVNVGEQYLQNLRYTERIILTIGISLIVGIILAVAPTNSDLRSRTSVLLLVGPLGGMQIIVTCIGWLRVKRTQEAMR